MSILMTIFLLQAAAEAPSATAQVASNPADDAKIVCRTMNATGSRLGGKRVCMSKKEWRRMDRESEEATRFYQDHQTKQPGNQ